MKKSANGKCITKLYQCVLFVVVVFVVVVRHSKNICECHTRNGGAPEKESFAMFIHCQTQHTILFTKQLFGVGIFWI